MEETLLGLVCLSRHGRLSLVFSPHSQGGEVRRTDDKSAGARKHKEAGRVNHRPKLQEVGPFRTAAGRRVQIWGLEGRKTRSWVGTACPLFLHGISGYQDLQ